MVQTDHNRLQSPDDGRVRPEIFLTAAWFLIAAALRLVLSRLARWLIYLFAGWDVDIRVGAQRGYELIYLLCVMALPVMLYARKGAGEARAIRLAGAKEKTCLLGGLIGILGVPTAQLITGWWCLLLRRLGASIDTGMAMPVSVPGLIVSVLFTGLLAAGCEELFFRGGLMGGWERRGSKRALAFSVIAFSLMHASFTGIWAQAYMGLILGFITLFSDSIWPALCAHAAYNVTTLLLGYFIDFNLSRAVMSLAGYGEALPILILDTAGCLLVTAMGLVVFRRVSRREGVEAAFTKGEGAQLDPRELMVLIAGFFTSGVALILDALSLFRSV